MTLAIPDDLKKQMDAHPEFNWSEIARQAFRRSISDIEAIRHFKRESTLTEEDAIRLGRELRRNISKHYMRD